MINGLAPGRKLIIIDDFLFESDRFLLIIYGLIVIMSLFKMILRMFINLAKEVSYLLFDYLIFQVNILSRNAHTEGRTPGW